MKKILLILLLFSPNIMAESTVIENDEWQMTWINANQTTTNYSTAAAAEWGNSERPEDDKVPIMLPDLSAIPAGSNIDSVHLIISDVWSADSVYQLWPIITSWSEASPNCWDSSSTENEWNTGGFSYATDLGSPADSCESGRSDGDDMVWFSGDGDGLCEAIQATLDGTAYGVAFYMEGNGSVTSSINTEDHATPGDRPTMTVIYTAGSSAPPYFPGVK